MKQENIGRFLLNLPLPIIINNSQSYDCKNSIGIVSDINSLIRLQT